MIRNRKLHVINSKSSVTNNKATSIEHLELAKKYIERGKKSKSLTFQKSKLNFLNCMTVTYPSELSSSIKQLRRQKTHLRKDGHIFRKTYLKAV